MREELHGFGDALSATLQNINAIAAVVLRVSAEIQALNAMIQVVEGLKMSTLVPEGASGVLLKSKAPLSWYSAERQGLMQEGCSRFSVSVACG